jgi:hypothetical protein
VKTAERETARTVTRMRVVQAIFSAIQQLAGFTRDSWLE